MEDDPDVGTQLPAVEAEAPAPPASAAPTGAAALFLSGDAAPVAVGGAVLAAAAAAAAAGVTRRVTRVKLLQALAQSEKMRRRVIANSDAKADANEAELRRQLEEYESKLKQSESRARAAAHDSNSSLSEELDAALENLAGLCFTPRPPSLTLPNFIFHHISPPPPPLCEKSKRDIFLT